MPSLPSPAANTAVTRLLPGGNRRASSPVRPVSSTDQSQPVAPAECGLFRAGTGVAVPVASTRSRQRVTVAQSSWSTKWRRSMVRPSLFQRSMKAAGRFGWFRVFGPQSCLGQIIRNPNILDLAAIAVAAGVAETLVIRNGRPVEFVGEKTSVEGGKVGFSVRTVAGLNDPALELPVLEDMLELVPRGKITNQAETKIELRGGGLDRRAWRSTPGCSVLELPKCCLALLGRTARQRSQSGGSRLRGVADDWVETRGGEVVMHDKQR